jgi:hypothetical protein
MVGAVGIEPTTFGLKVWFSQFRLFGISDLRSGCSVVLPLSGLIQSVLRTFSVPMATQTHLHKTRHWTGVSATPSDASDHDLNLEGFSWKLYCHSCFRIDKENLLVAFSNLDSVPL